MAWAHKILVICMLGSVSCTVREVRTPLTVSLDETKYKIVRVDTLKEYPYSMPVKRTLYKIKK